MSVVVRMSDDAGCNLIALLQGGMNMNRLMGLRRYDKYGLQGGDVTRPRSGLDWFGRLTI